MLEVKLEMTSEEPIQTSPTVIDLYCGIGGSSLGFQNAGYDVRLGVDIDAIACEIYTNNLGIKSIESDILEYTPEQCKEDANLEKDNIDVVICCPPCQGFSKIRRNGEDDPRNDLIEYTANFVLKLNPTMIVFENVRGIVFPKNIAKFKEFQEILGNQYLLSDRILNAVDYGIPQNRERVFLFGIRKNARDHPLTFPEITHGEVEVKKKAKKLLPYATVKDVIGDLPSLVSGEKSDVISHHKATEHTDRLVERFKHIPKNGGSRSDLPEKYVLSCHKKFYGFKDVYGRMLWDQPSPTLTGGCLMPSKGRFLHPEDDRGLTAREALRIQTFPDDFNFSIEEKTKVGNFIGNSVPPGWMKIIATHIAKEMEWENRLKK